MSNYEPRVLKIQKSLYPSLELSRDDWKYGDIPDKYGNTDIRYNKIFSCKLQSSYKCDICDKQYNNSISYSNKENRCLNCLTDNARYDDYDVFFVTESIDFNVVPKINQEFKENMTRIKNEESSQLKCSKCNLEKISKFFFKTKEGEGPIYCFMCYLHMPTDEVSESRVHSNSVKKSPKRSKKSPVRARKSPVRARKSPKKSLVRARKSLRSSKKSPNKSPIRGRKTLKKSPKRRR
jgi:transcription elongation factor Elf1